MVNQTDDDLFQTERSSFRIRRGLENHFEIILNCAIFLFAVHDNHRLCVKTLSN